MAFAPTSILWSGHGAGRTGTRPEEAAKLIQIVFWLGVALAVIALVGHALWLLVAAVLRALTGSGSRPQGAGRTSPLEALERERTAFQRRLDDLRDRGLLDPETYRRVIEAERAERLSTSVPPHLARRPAAAPPAPVARPPVSPPAAAEEPARAAEILSASGPPPAVGSPLPAAAPEVRPPETPAATPAPVERRRPFGQVLASFLQEKNIRWGELTAGMLIVFCSTALAMSLWQKIAENPIGRFAIFLAVNTALFGAAFFTHHRWKLPQTSISLLVISTLLVPLNFLALAAFSRGALSRSGMVLFAEAVALPLFSILVFKAGRVLARPWAVPLTLGVIVPSAAQLLFRRFAGEYPAPWVLLGLNALPLAAYAVSAAWPIAGRWRRGPLERDETMALFTVLGLSTFAALLANGLLAHVTGDASRALRELSPAIGLQGWPALAVGLFAWRRLRPQDSPALRVAGTAVALGGAMVMALGLALAWPRPSVFVPAAFLDFAILAAAAFAFDLAPLYLPSGAFLTAGFLVGVQVAFGRYGWGDQDSPALLRRLLSAFSGTALIGLALGAAAPWAVHARLGRREAARAWRLLFYLISCLSLLLVSAFGFGRAGSENGTAWAYLFYSLAAFAIAWKSGRGLAAAASSALLFAAIVQALVFRSPGQVALSGPWLSACLSHASVLAGVSAFLEWRGRGGGRTPMLPLWISSLLTSSGAAALIIHTSSIGNAGPLSLRALWLGAVWLVLAATEASPFLFTVAQGALVWAMELAVTAGLSQKFWFQTTPHPLLDPRTLRAQGSAIGACLVLWIVFRIAIRRFWPRPAANGSEVFGPRQLWMVLVEENASWKGLEGLLAAAVLLLALGLGLYGAWPGIVSEIWNSSVPPERVLGGSAYWFAYESRWAWALPCILGVALLAGLWERFDPKRILALIALGAAGCLLLAAPQEAQGAGASALRWWLAGYWLLGSLLLWCRGGLARVVSPLRWPEWEVRSPPLAQSARRLLVAATILPVLALTISSFLALSGALSGGSPPALPGAQSVFGRVGPQVNYCLPLAALSAGLVGHALRERSAAYGFAAGLVVNLIVTLGNLLSIRLSPSPHFGSVELIRLGQLNAIAAASYGLSWMGLRFLSFRLRPASQEEGGGATPPVPALLVAQIAVASAINLLLVWNVAAWLIGRPEEVGVGIGEAGSAAGWIAFVLSASGVAWLVHRRGRPFHPGWVFFGALIAGALVAFSTARASSAAWLSYHVLLASAVCAAWMALGAGWLAARGSAGAGTAPPPPPGGAERRDPSVRWTVLGGALGAVLALRAAGADPAWGWSVGALLGIGVLASVLGFSLRRDGYLYASGALFNAAATVWWVVTRWARPWPTDPGEQFDLIHLNGAVLAVPALAMLLLGRFVLRRNPERGLFPGSYHRAAAMAAMGAVIFPLANEFGARLLGHRFDVRPGPAWAALGSSAALLVAALWDPRASFAPAALLITALAASARALLQSHLEEPWLTASFALAASGSLLLSGALWWRRGRWRPTLSRLGIAPLAGPALGEFGMMSALASVLALAASVRVALGWVARSPLGPNLPLGLGGRLLSSSSGLVAAMGLALLSGGRPAPALRRLALWLGVAGAVAWAWAWIDPQGPHDDLLHRLVLLTTAVAAVTALFGSALARTRSASDWTEPCRRALPMLAVIALGSLVAVIAAEAAAAEGIAAGTREVAWPAITVIACAIAALAVTAIWLALAPERDPLRLSERGRMAYVYGAEALLALLFTHLRLTAPQLFHGFFARYWPVVVMGIAFLGVGLGEVFRRRRVLVLAEPLERTGIFLPFLPVLAFWLNGVPRSRVDYSLQLALAGSLYAGLSAFRRSLRFGLLAALGASGALWYLLHRTTGLGFLQHPQLWLIPAALLVLLAAYFNRQDLTTAQMVAVRYACMIAVYLSSTADVFIAGVARSPWMPMVLAGLSVAGVLAGIALRVRSFLFLGSGFLLLSLITMVWYAAERYDWTWLWWLTGIALGFALYFLFAMIEKRRGTVVVVADNLREWEG
jgi:hypothetical protein